MAFAATASKRGAFADMNKAAIDVAKALVRLSEVTIFELRGEWRRLHRMPPPMRLPNPRKRRTFPCERRHSRKNRHAWLPFLDTYRTMCLAPDFRRVLEDVRAMQLAA